MTHTFQGVSLLKRNVYLSGILHRTKFRQHTTKVIPLTSRIEHFVRSSIFIFNSILN